MPFEHPTYISLDLPENVAAAVRAMRRWFDPDFADLPVEISIAGSSGLGQVAWHRQCEPVFGELDRIAAALGPVIARFSPVDWLAGLGIYAIGLEEIERLAHVQKMLRQSAIRFRPTTLPFQPHCAIRWTQEWPQDFTESDLRSAAFPRGEFLLESMSIYELQPHSGGASLLHRTRLGG